MASEEQAKESKRNESFGTIIKVTGKKPEQRQRVREREHLDRGVCLSTTVRLGTTVTWLRYPVSIAGWLLGAPIFSTALRDFEESWVKLGGPLSIVSRCQYIFPQKIAKNPRNTWRTRVYRWANLTGPVDGDPGKRRSSEKFRTLIQYSQYRPLQDEHLALLVLLAADRTSHPTGSARATARSNTRDAGRAAPAPRRPYRFKAAATGSDKGAPRNVRRDAEELQKKCAESSVYLSFLILNFLHSRKKETRSLERFLSRPYLNTC